MCTVTWQSTGPGSYELHFNRDELRTRKPALAPALDTQLGTRYMAPKDGDAGGTWIAANEHGLTVCILNDYESLQPAGNDWVSRGHLVTSLASSTDAVSAFAGLDAETLSRFRPFVLLAVDPKDVLSLRWDGRLGSLRTSGVEAPLTSSSSDPLAVRAIRSRVMDTLRSQARDGGRLDLAQFHRSHLPAKGAFSPCMHRAEASTVSYCRVAVTTETIAMSYAPGNPCGAVEPKPLVLERNLTTVSA